jgi:hypothetical protein
VGGDQGVDGRAARHTGGRRGQADVGRDTVRITKGPR